MGSLNLDRLRAFAVTLVLVDHVLEMIENLHPELSFYPYAGSVGRSGVLLFFVHTSLVLNHSLARLNLKGVALIRSFLIRRAFRIFPLSILCVLIVLAFGVPYMPWRELPPPSVGGIVSNLALTMNLTYTIPVLGPLWSLPVEAQMYTALPLIFLVFGKRTKALLMLWAVAVVIAAVQPFISERLTVLSYAPCFIAGVLAYSLKPRGSLPSYLWFPFLIALVGLYVIAQPFLGGLDRPAQWALCLLLGLSIPAFTDAKTAPVSKVIAKYSYGIYLFHCIALWAGLIVLHAAPSVQWASAAMILVVLTVSAFHLIEKPSIDFGSKVATPEWKVAGIGA